MKRLTIILFLSLVPALCVQAGCPRLEYNELKDMKQHDLIRTRCDYYGEHSAYARRHHQQFLKHDVYGGRASLYQMDVCMREAERVERIMRDRGLNPSGSCT
jgi:hypothetical protein